MSHAGESLPRHAVVAGRVFWTCLVIVNIAMILSFAFGVLDETPWPMFFALVGIFGLLAGLVYYIAARRG